MQDWATDASPVLIADGVARFGEPADAHIPTAPSFALLREPQALGRVPVDWRTIPLFGRRVPGEARVVCIAADAGTSLYGTGEVPGPLLRNGRTTVCWNTDSFKYDQT